MPSERAKFLAQVRKGCRIAERLRQLGIRPNGVVRLDSASPVEAWYEDPMGNQKRIAETFREACKIAEDHGERLAAEGEICWGGMHSWKRMLQLLEMVDRAGTLGFEADMAHTLLYLLGYNAPEDAILPANFNWRNEDKFEAAYCQLTAALRPWTIDFHVAQSNATVHGSGSHDKTGRHCLPGDAQGKLDIPLSRRLLAPRRAGRADQADPAHLLGRLHVPQRRDDGPPHLAEHLEGHDRRARQARLGGVALAIPYVLGRECSLAQHGLPFRSWSQTVCQLNNFARFSNACCRERPRWCSKFPGTARSPFPAAMIDTLLESYTVI